MNKEKIKQEKNIERPFEELISESFGRYAKYIIQDRALPDLRDGLKPVQRRILYTAYLDKLFFKNPHKKSATLVGNVMGSYHPHGDSSIYEAIVRMCQPWKSNMPLLEMHGNLGSIDGDPAAAYRYTEVRLSEISESLLKNIEKKTVEFIHNFDDTKLEPVVLPSLFFNLMINGSSGIAAGYATNIPPFNLSEVSELLIKFIDNPDLSIDEIMKILPAPDFPTEGIIEATPGIKEAYETGKGKFFIHANHKVIENKKINQLIFTDIPFETNKSAIIRQIEELIIKNNFSDVTEIRDESDGQGISIVLDINKEANTNSILNFLYKNTDLRVSYNINFVVIHDRKPKLLGIKELFTNFLIHLKKIIVAGFNFDVFELKKQLEITEGLIKAIGILDEIIATIRKSKNKSDAKENLIKKYNFTDNQSESIVQLRLYRLSSSDHSDLINQKKEMLLKLSELEFLLNSEIELKKWIKNLISNFLNKFGYKRKSIIQKNSLDLNINISELIVEKKLFLIWLSNNQIKLIDFKKTEENELINNKIKDNDLYLDIFEVNNKDQLLFLTNLGKMILVPVHKFEIKKTNMIPQNIHEVLNLEIHEKIIGIHRINFLSKFDNKEIVLTTIKGLTKKVKLSEIVKLKIQKLITIIKLNSDDYLIKSLFLENSNGSLIYLSKKGFINHVLNSSINCLSRVSMGQKAMKLKSGDEIVEVLEVPSEKNAFLFLNFKEGYKKIKFNSDFDISRLNYSGVSCNLKKDNELIQANFFDEIDNFLILDKLKKWTLINLSKFNAGTFKSPIQEFDMIYFSKNSFFNKKMKYESHIKNEEITKLF